MQKQNMVKWLEEVKANPVKKAMPVLSFPAIQLMDITVKDFINSSDYQAKGMKMICDKVDCLASVSLMDLSLEAEAFGSVIRFSDDEVPTVIGRIIETQEDADALLVPKIGAGRTGIYLEAMEKAVALITDRPVFAGCIGSFSLAGRLMDVTEAMINCYEEPEMVHTTLQKATDFIISYAKAYKNTGCNGIVIAEPLAGMLSPALMEEFSTPYIKQIVDAVQDEEFIVCYHNCGNDAIKLIDSILKVGSGMFHFGNKIDMGVMMTHIPSNVVAMGNVDPAGEFRNGTVESVKEATQKVLTACGGYTNFVPSSGCDIPPLSSWRNIEEFFAVVKEYYNK